MKNKYFSLGIIGGRNGFLIALVFFFTYCWSHAQNDQYTPIEVSGYNFDVVADGVGSAINSTDKAFDASNFCYVSADFKVTESSSPISVGLPDDGIISSPDLSGLTYQMGMDGNVFAGNNTLRIDNNSGSLSGTLEFENPGSYAKLFFLVASGDGSSTMSVEVHFDDETSQEFTGIDVPDWFNTGLPAEISGVGRINRSNNQVETPAGNPKLFRATVELDGANFNKNITGVTFTKTNTFGDSVLNIMGVSAEYSPDDCFGTPTAGTPDETELSFCAGTSFSISVSGNSIPATGQTQIWQSSPAGEDDWTDILGATGSVLNIATGIMEDTDYRYRVYCENSDEEDISEVIQVSLKPGNECYCIPTNSGNNSDEILNFTLAGLDNDSAPSEGLDGMGYSDYSSSAPPAVLEPGSSYVASLTSNIGSGNHGAAIWIDYNDNGIFEPGEMVAHTSNITGNQTVDFPAFVVADMPGTHRLRVQYRYNASGEDLNPCDGVTTYSETEDYSVNIVVLEDCEGTPDPGIALDNFDVCAGISFIISVTEASEFANGLTRQWQSSPAGQGDWTDLEGGNFDLFQIQEGITEPTDFRYALQCMDDNPVYSDIIEVTLKPGTECYCTPAFTYGCSINASISNVTLVGESETINESSGCSEDFADNTDVTPADLAPGYNYTLSVTTPYASPQFVELGVWIDFDQNGSFEDEGEQLHSGGNGMGSATKDIEFNIPDDMEPGLYRLRIRTVYSTANPFTACSTENYGETEDYFIEILQLDECEGTVTAGIPVETEILICPNNPFTLKVEDASEPAAGLTRIWQSSPAGEEEWTDISGAFMPEYTIAEGIDEHMDYRYTVVCENNEESDLSDIIQVTVNENPSECYCIPHGTNSNYTIQSFSTSDGSQNINNMNSGFSDGGYGDYTDMVVSQVPGESISFSATLTGSTFGMRIWVDWNQDGQFNTSTEVAFQSSSYSAAHNGTITVPENALNGPTRMRVAIHYLSNTGDIDPCAVNFPNGEFEDYTFEVIPLEDCAGTPTAGIVDNTEIEICAGIGFSLITNSASDIADGLTRTWQSSPPGEDDWTDLEGGLSPNYYLAEGIFEDTDFRYVVTCANSDETDISEVISVTLKPGVECYCTPVFTTGCSSNDTINNVTLIGESVSLDNDSDCSSNHYADYTEDDSIPVPDLAPGETYTLSVHTNYSSPTFEDVRAWIDFNQNGSFESEEEIGNTGGSGMSVSGTANFAFFVPEDAAAGVYRMRVRMVYSGGGNIDPCASASYGETEDYSISIIQLDDCEGPVTGGTIDEEDFDVCGSMPFTLTVSGASDPAEGLTRTWQFSPADEDNWTDISGAQTANYTHSGINEPTKFRYKVVCTNSGDEDFSNEITVTLKPAVECYCTPASGSGTPSYYITQVVTDGALQDLDHSSGSSEGGYGDHTDQILVTYPGQVFTFQIYGSSASMNYDGWMDMNQNGNFEDPGEHFLTTNGGYVDSPYSGTITMPAELPAGTYRLRIRNSWLSSGLGPCDSDTWGEVEDYTIQVIFPDCFPPLNIAANFVTDDSADISWDIEEGQDSWMVIYGETGFDPESEDATSISVEGDPFVTLSDLDSETTYQVYVKTLCSDTEESFLIGPVSFTTNITPPENTRLCDAIHLDPNMGCAGGPYTNVAAFEESGEPGGSCLNNFRGHNSVWFTFEAPESGHGILSTNFSQTSFTTEMVAFEGPADCDDMSTLGAEVACANNGNDLEFFDLNPGEIYYVKVTGFNEAEGMFCIGYEPDGDLVNVDVQVFENFTYYPNPVENELTLKAGNIIESVSLFNLLGQKVTEVNPGAAETTLNTSALQNGVYFIKVNIEGAEKTFRIIKK